VLDEMAAILRAGGYPIEISLQDDGASANLSPSAAEILADLKEALAALYRGAAPWFAGAPRRRRQGGLLPP